MLFRGGHGAPQSLRLLPSFTPKIDFLNLRVGLSVMVLHACPWAARECSCDLMLTSLRVQSQGSDRLQEAMVNFGFFFFRFLSSDKEKLL